MKIHIRIFFSIALCVLVGIAYCTASVNEQNSHNEKMDSLQKETVVLMQTSLGDVEIILYNETPKHRDNFIKLVNDGYYDGVLFHRVIKNFMVQTGDPDSKNANSNKHLGGGGPDYTIEAEFMYPKRFHKYGALAAARTGDQVNPDRRSSGSQFYIVTGDKYTDDQLSKMEQQVINRQYQDYFRKLQAENIRELQSLYKSGNKEALDSLIQQLQDRTTTECRPSGIPDEIRQAYTTVGGTPHLDGQYTVFGEVVKGMEVIEKIQNAETGVNDRPKEDIYILKMSII